MKWLQWSKSNLETGLGGVEVHARCLARELRLLGVEVQFSNDPRELSNNEWDVIHTHGSGYVPSRSRATTVHTLHGTTLGRMASCGEWLWPGGYLAESREVRGIFGTDLTLSVHPGLSLYRLARMTGKSALVCGNGWDAAAFAASAIATGPAADITAELAKTDPARPLWLFVGRGDDIVKGADRIRTLLQSSDPFIKKLQIMTIPGTGFERDTNTIRTGRLSNEQVRELMTRAHGIIVPSRYEGNSLAVLEALACGTHVISTRVGGVTMMPPGVQGLEVIQNGNSDVLLQAIQKLELSFGKNDDRKTRSEVNQRLLPQWRQVAESALKGVEIARKSSGRKT